MGRRSVLLNEERVRFFDLTTCDFFLWGCVKKNVFVPRLPLDTDELKLRITATIETVGGNVSERVWDALDYRLDIFRVTNGTQIYHL
jgi:hypothetical protein